MKRMIKEENENTYSFLAKDDDGFLSGRIKLHKIGKYEYQYEVEDINGNSKKGEIDVYGLWDGVEDIINDTFILNGHAYLYSLNDKQSDEEIEKMIKNVNKRYNQKRNDVGTIKESKVKKTLKEENTENKMEIDKKHERLFFENFKNKLHKNAFGFYEVYNWIYDMTGIMPHKDEVEMFINNWEKKGWIDVQSNRFDEKVYLISKAERTMQKAPIVKNVPIAESKKRRMMKESIDKERTIEITDKMKSTYPSLEYYDEIILSYKDTDWWEADRYANEVLDGFLPNTDEAKDIFEILNLDKGMFIWTREILNEYPFQSVHLVKSNGDTWEDNKSQKYKSVILR